MGRLSVRRESPERLYEAQEYETMRGDVQSIPLAGVVVSPSVLIRGSAA